MAKVMWETALINSTTNLLLQGFGPTGKTLTYSIVNTIVPTNGAERTGYPTQKPEGLVRRFVSASSRPGGWCLDFFAGSGTLGAVCAALGRRYVLVDSNPEAVAVMLERLSPSAARPARARS